MEVHGNVEIGTLIEHQVNYISGNQVFGETNVEKQSTADNAVKEAIEKLMEEVDESGERLFSDKGQWYAVYRVLSEKFNYPTNMSEFCRLFEDESYPVSCIYSSLTDRQKKLPKLACKVELWQQYAMISDAYRKQCDVAVSLLKILGRL